MSRYRKIDPRVWNDEKFVRLAPEEKLVALYLLTAQCNRIGIFSFSKALAAEDIGMLPQTFAKRFENVISTFNWHWDKRCRVLYLPTWWKYNQPENSNNVVGNLKDLADVPSSDLIAKFATNLQYLAVEFHKTFNQTFAERYPERYPKGSASQEQEQEQDPDPDSPASLSLVPAKENPKNFRTAGLSEFETAWNLYPKRAGGNSKENALKAWSARIRANALPADMIAGVERYAAFIRATGKEHTQFVMQAATFFGPEKHYLEEFELPRTGADAKRSAGGFVG